MTCIFCVKKEHKLYTSFFFHNKSTNDYFFIKQTFNLIIVKKIITVFVQRSLFYCMYFTLKSKGSQIFSLTHSNLQVKKEKKEKSKLFVHKIQYSAGTLPHVARDRESDRNPRITWVRIYREE